MRRHFFRNTLEPIVLYEIKNSPCVSARGILFGFVLFDQMFFCFVPVLFKVGYEGGATRADRSGVGAGSLRLLVDIGARMVEMLCAKLFHPFDTVVVGVPKQ